jgi:hypothetical protein
MSPTLDTVYGTNGAGWAANLASHDTYNALVNLEESLRVALGESANTDVSWAGASIADDGMHDEALSIISGLALDRADVTGNHNQLGDGWMLSGGVNWDEVEAAQELYGKVKNALGG